MTNPLLFRFHRGSLDESMQTVIEIWSYEHLLSHIRKHWDPPISSLKIEPYCLDERIDWDTHIVYIAIGNDTKLLLPVGFLNKLPPWMNCENKEPELTIDELYDQADYGFNSVRTVRALKGEGITHLHMLKEKTVNDLYKIPNLGKKSITELVYLAKKNNIQISGCDSHMIRRIEDYDKSP